MSLEKQAQALPLSQRLAGVLGHGAQAFGGRAMDAAFSVGTNALNNHIAARMAPPAASPLKGMLVNAGTLMGVMGAAHLGGKAMSHMAINASFQKMLQLYPELQRENPDRVKLYFDAIAQGSPDLASNPLAVGSLIKRMLNYDGFDHSTFGDLVSMQTSIDKVRADQSRNSISLAESGMGLMRDYGVGVPPRTR